MTPPYDRDEFCLQFGMRLRQARRLRGLSQAALAHMAGYVTQTISNLERGVSLPSLIVVFVLSEALEVEPKELLFGFEE